MKANDLLLQYGLRKTASRASILDVFLKNTSAQSESDIEAKLNGLCDRATIYRTINTFESEGIIHRVLDENNVVKYALCREDCHDGHHHHEHVHFKCEDCGATVCLEQTLIQPVNLPLGFKAKEANLLVIGTCQNCNQQHS